MGARLSSRGEARITFPRPGRTVKLGNAVKLEDRGAKNLTIAWTVISEPLFGRKSGALGKGTCFIRIFSNLASGQVGKSLCVPCAPNFFVHFVAHLCARNHSLRGLL